jgi:hypothetical protein
MWLSPTGISAGPAGEIHIRSVSFKCVSSFLIDSTQVYRTSFMLSAVRLLTTQSLSEDSVRHFCMHCAFGHCFLLSELTSVFEGGLDSDFCNGHAKNIGCTKMRVARAR